jgi:integrase
VVMAAGGASRGRRGGGTRRERRPGVWEIRVTTGSDPAAGRSRQASFTHRGDADSAACRQAELVELYGAVPVVAPPQSAAMTVGELLEAFVAAPHRWSVTTWRSHRGNAAIVCRDGLGRARLDRMTPNTMERAIERWSRAGAGAATLGGRFRTLHSAITWAVRNQLLVEDPLAGMSGPSRPAPRQHLRPGEVRRLIQTADELVEKAAAAVAERPYQRSRHGVLFRAEQDALLVRLAADAALRRGELAALQLGDLSGRKLSVGRSSQDGVIGPVKNHLRATLTLGVQTAACWSAHVARWQGVADQGLWLFSATPRRRVPLQPGGLGQRFDRLARAAGLPGACLHRLRHTVGTYLVAEGKLLQASQRLRHRDVSTTFREYVHALPLDDREAADQLARLYGMDSEPANLT